MSKTVLFQIIQFNQQSYMVPSFAMYNEQVNQTSVIYLHKVKCQNSSISNNSV